MVGGYHHVPAFPGETGEPADLLPALGRIFAGVRIAACEQYRIPAPAAHEGPEPLYPVRENIVHALAEQDFGPAEAALCSKDLGRIDALGEFGNVVDVDAEFHILAGVIHFT